eukprot:TRINITY_DN55836_c0_g1_i1.p1 TRINITY_DN55836_c0_g1~~TRINITY_DN55836_c0_g1_i1.p1  ORF type:complete len:174 (+),score=42.16 TRINITY_DN55836_c0_g1_i1:60-524(+)
MSEASMKELQIKLGTVKRTKKEYEMYLKEEGTQRDKIEKMKTEGKDEYDIKKQVEVLNDTLTVIPDTRQRLQRYLADLKKLTDEEFGDVLLAQPAGSGEDGGANASTDTPLVQLVREARQLLDSAGEDMELPTDAGASGAATGGTGEANDDEEY